VQGRGRFDAIEVNHLTAVEHGEVAGFAELIHQPLRDRAARAADRGAHHYVDAQAYQVRSHDIALAIGCNNKTRVLEQDENAVDGQFRQRDLGLLFGEQRWPVRAHNGEAFCIKGNFRSCQEAARAGLISIFSYLTFK